MRRYNPVLVTTTPLVATLPSSQHRPRHKQASRDNHANHVTTTPLSHTHHLHNKTLQSRPRHNSAHVTTTPLVITLSASQPKMTRYIPVLVTAKPLVITPPSSQYTTTCEMRHYNPVLITTTPLVTTLPSSQLRPRHKQASRDNHAIFTRSFCCC